MKNENEQMTEKRAIEIVDKSLDNGRSLDSPEINSLAEWIKTDPKNADTVFYRFLMHVLLKDYFEKEQFKAMLGAGTMLPGGVKPEQLLYEKYKKAIWAVFITAASSLILIISLVVYHLVSGYSEGLILHWDFDELWNGKYVKDVSGHGRDGEIIDSGSSDSYYELEKNGQFLAIRNTDYRMESDHVAANLVLPDSGTIALWFKTTNLFDHNNIFDNSDYENNWEMWLSGASVLFFRIQHDTYVSCTLNELTDEKNCIGKWWHVAVTWQKSGKTIGIAMYINGVKVNSDMGLWVKPGQTFNLGAGHPSNKTGNLFLNDFRIYDCALEAGEIRDMVVPNSSSFDVDAGEDIKLRLEDYELEVDLSGSLNIHDENNKDEFTYRWEHVYGPECVIDSPETLKTTVHFFEPGQYVFQLNAITSIYKNTDKIHIEIYSDDYEGLVAYFPFDGDINAKKGNIKSQLIDGIDGEHIFVTGVQGESLQITGKESISNNDYLAINYRYGNRGTVAFWFKLLKLYDYNSILDNSCDVNDWEIWVYGNGQLAARLQNGYLKSPVLNLGTWYHIAFVWKRDEVKQNMVNEQLYINGDMVAENIDNIWTNPGETLFLGGGHPLQDDSNSMFDELYIYEKCLTGDEIKGLMEQISNK